MHYSKNSKNWDIEIMYFSCHKKEAFFVKFIFSYNAATLPKGADAMANRADPDQTTPIGAV